MQIRAPDSAEASTDAAATHENRICIIGCGNVGMAAAYALIQSSFVRQLVLIGSEEEKVEGEVMDLQHAVAVPMRSPIAVTKGDYADAGQSSIVVIAAGVATTEAEASRLDLAEANAAVIREIVGELRANGFKGILIVATNPVDVLAQVAHDVSGLPARQVIGTGTLIDTARLRGMIADICDVEPRAVEAFVIGEHGDSEIAVWSGARVGGVRLDRYPGADRLPAPAEMLDHVRQAAHEVIRRKGHTAYAIGLAIQRICEAVLRNERAVLPVSTLLDGEYGLSGIYLGTPCIIGKNGVEQIIALDLNEDEKAGLIASATALKAAYDSVSHQA